MKVSSSMISTSVAISSAISRPAVSASLPDLGDVGMQHEGDLFLGEAFQRQQQERLPRQRRDVRQPPLGRHRQRPHIGVVIQRDRIPDLRKQPEKTGARAVLLVEQRRILQQGLQHRRDIGVAGSLACRSARAHSGAATVNAQQPTVISTSPLQSRSLSRPTINAGRPASPAALLTPQRHEKFHRVGNFDRRLRIRLPVTLQNLQKSSKTLDVSGDLTMGNTLDQS